VTTATEAAAASTLPRLNRSLDLGHSAAARLLPERVLQFGEGNFLRAFVDWMLERMNRAGVFNGRAVLIQPIAQGLADAINEQDGLYTVVLRGRQDGQIVDTKELVSAVSRCVDPYRDFEGFLATAGQPDLRFVVSNTTEAGAVVPGQADPAALRAISRLRWRSGARLGHVAVRADRTKRRQFTPRGRANSPALGIAGAVHAVVERCLCVHQHAR
jgi:hypothetical protein